MPDDATTGLIFASDQANHNFARVLGDLRRAHLSITHRLHSIRRDAAFVASVARAYAGFALVANERCGSWYMPVAGDDDDDAAATTSRKAGSAYFKSTDGHTGQWSFSMRRLNLHLPLLVCQSGGGIILVDSTRRGKRMPDALSKTVPMWCCVLNRALFASLSPGSPGEADAMSESQLRDTQTLYTPPGVVSASEHCQMLARVPAFVDGLLKLGVLGDDVAAVAAWRHRNLPNGKPLRPVWITPDTPWPDVEALRGRFNVVLCCTASHVPSDDDGQEVRRGTRVDGYAADYIQGAADDTENWAHGLTPELYFAHCRQLLDTPEADLPALIQSLVRSGEQKANAADAQPPDATSITPQLSAGPWTGPEPPPPPPPPPPLAPGASPSLCQIVVVRRTTEPDSWATSQNSLEVGIGKQDKIAGRNLRYALPTICNFVAAYLARPSPGPKRVCVLCPTGRDISIGVALAVLCFCFDDAGRARTADNAPLASAAFSKDTIRARLGRIMAAMPHANPSRATLQSVNSFLMDLPRQ